MKHRVLRWFVAFAVGVALAMYAFDRVTDPEPRLQRAREEAAVMTAREILQSYVAPTGQIELVDPLAANRKVGKVFVYPTDAGWEISGHYRRNPGDSWHPFLMSLDPQGELVSLAVRDANERLIGMSAQDPKFSAVP
jgi:hypothetical protein